MIADPLARLTQCAKAKYPTLFKMALEFRSIPCTSCECERSLSGGGNPVTTDWNSLHGSTIKALQLPKKRLKNGVVDSSLKNLVKWLKKLHNPLKLRRTGLEIEET